MVERYIKFLGLDETIKLLEANQQPLVPSIRVNTLKMSALELRQRLEKKGFVLEPIEWVPHGFKVIKGPRILGSLHEFLQGYYYLQGIASMLAAVILDPKSNETVIDMCAAPGSKATHLAQLMNNKGNLILIEKNERRTPALELNLRRMGVFNSILFNLDAVDLGKLNVKADKILLDAPCTGEGLIRLDIKRKTSRTENDIKKMAKIQKKLLIAGLNTLKPGGKLLYSTCSIGPEENELVIDQVLQNKSSHSIIRIPIQYGKPGLTNVYGINLDENLKFSQKLYPHIHDTIGFFYCLIQKVN